MNSAEPLTPDDDLRAQFFFLETLRHELILTGQISRRDWDNAVEAANRYKRSLVDTSDQE